MANIHNKREALKAFEQWLSNHRTDSSYNIVNGKNFTATPKGPTVNDTQFNQLLNGINKIDKKVDKLETKVDKLETKVDNGLRDVHEKIDSLTRIVKKNHPKDFE